MADVFISYKCETDRASAEAITKLLKSLDIECWYAEIDQSEYKASKKSERTRRKIYNKVNREQKAASVILVLWSDASVDREWVQREADRGRANKKLCQVAIKGLDPMSVPAPFDQAAVIDLSGWSFEGIHDGWTKVLKEIGQKVGRTGLADYYTLVSSPDTTLADRESWARYNPGDPFAETIWNDSLAERSQIFDDAVARLQSERAQLLGTFDQTFEAKLADYRRHLDNHLREIKTTPNSKIPDPTGIWTIAESRRVVDITKRIKEIPELKLAETARAEEEKLKAKIHELTEQLDERSAHIEELRQEAADRTLATRYASERAEDAVREHAGLSAEVSDLSEKLVAASTERDRLSELLEEQSALAQSLSSDLADTQARLRDATTRSVWRRAKDAVRSTAVLLVIAYIVGKWVFPDATTELVLDADYRIGKILGALNRGSG